MRSFVLETPSSSTRSWKTSRIILESKVSRFLEYEGDHLILVGEVAYAEGEEGLDKISPLLHDSGEKSRTIGKEVMLKRKK